MGIGRSWGLRWHGWAGYDAFSKRLAETPGSMKVADGFEPGVVIGPLIDMKAVEKVEARIAAPALLF